MSTRITKSLTWLWIAALFFATVGVSVRQMYCYCAGTTTSSLFTVQDACAVQQRADHPGCCHKPEPRPVRSCCDKDNETCSATEHDGCMEKSIRVFQLKTEFVVDNPLDKTFDCPLWIEKMPVFRHYFRPAICEAVVNFKPPPPLSGRDICMRHQLFRC